MHAFRQNRVSGAVWPWVAQGGITSARPRRPWRRLLVSAVVGAGVASYLLAQGHRTPAGVIYGIVGILLACGVFAPALHQRIERLFGAFGHAVGIALTWVLLVPFFYLVFPFGRLCLTLKGKDPLTRAFPADAPSCWTRRRRIDDVERHFRRQFG